MTVVKKCISEKHFNKIDKPLLERKTVIFQVISYSSSAPLVFPFKYSVHVQSPPMYLISLTISLFDNALF